MTFPNILIYNLPVLYNIFNELSDDLDYKFFNVSLNELPKFNYILSKETLIISSKKLKYKNHIILDKKPITITKILEQINLSLLKNKFKKNSSSQIGKYLLDINSRNLLLKNQKIKLTEKEINILLFLKEKKNSSIKELQKNVWGYKEDLETHTVETHIHRLKKKIKEKFGDKKFLLRRKEGYLINWEKKKIKLLKSYLRQNLSKKLLNPRKEKAVIKEKANLKI